MAAPETATAHIAESIELARLAEQLKQLHRLYDDLQSQVRHDALTGLVNRSHFIELLDQASRAAAQRAGTLAVLFIGLDRFQPINQALGHSAGDRLLQEAGQRLRRLLTEDDFAGRVGGDEFAAVLTLPPDEQKFLEALREPYHVDGLELFVTASIGVSLFPRHGDTSAELLKNANQAMRQAKLSGRNSVQVFLRKDPASGLERLQIENALRRALEHHELHLLYQPVVNMQGKVKALEALLTWSHPVHGTISPKQFIPIAEETGLIVEIGSWVLEQACLQGERWRTAGHGDLAIAVNVSALQFERDNFVESVAAALAMSGLPPHGLELELTVRYVMRDLPESARRMSRLRDLGVSIAIDDFGTGYSSLSYLNKLPVDALKIDQSFLRGMHEVESSLPVLQSIIRLAHSMNLTVVAEGVETSEDLELIKLLGCDKAQGRLFGMPVPSDLALLLLQSRNTVPR